MINENLKNRALNPPSKGDPVPREKIIKLGKKITDDVKHQIGGVSSDDPEYWGIADLITDEMADIALAMKQRRHYTVEELWKLCKVSKEEREHFQEVLDEMSYIGLLEYDYGNHYDHNGRTAPQSERRYVLPRLVPGTAELLNMEEGPEGNRRLREHPEVASFFERMTYTPLEGITQFVPPGGGGIGMHVIPVEKAVEMENTSVDLEHISYWLKKYEGHIGVGQCSCRVSCAALGEGCADDEMGWCIGLGDFADYATETGKGHPITYDEAMDILKKAEDNGFVHQITNIDGENKIFAICNCNANVCYALRTSQLFNTPNLSKSAYTAEVKKENCTACGKCVEVCPAGAVKLGQKLCTREGEKVYPKHELPNGITWGSRHWDPDYRDNNRINCYEGGTSPCKSACPAHVSVQGYLKLTAQGKYKEALALIKKDNPFPAVCGRICNKRCEEACTRGTVDQAVAIDAVKRFIAEQDLDSDTRYIPPVVIASARFTNWDQKIAIIGAGPAGLSAAYYLAVKGYKPTVFEKNDTAGGMMIYGIPSYKLEKDVIQAEIDVIRELGVDIRCGVEIGKDLTIGQLRDQGYQAFYIAAGCQEGIYPDIPKVKGEGTDLAVHFLHEAAVNKDQKIDGDVVVIGGGNVAIDAARTAERFGARSVTVVSLEDKDYMPALKEEIAEASDEDIIIDNCWGPAEVMRSDDGKVTGISLKRCLRTVDPDTGAFSPLYDENNTKTIKADLIIFAIGQKVSWGDLLKGTKVRLSGRGYPIADPLTYQTDDPDIFVGGDVFHGPKFVIDAIEDGKCAAESLHRYVQPGADLKIGRNRREFIMLDKDDIAVSGYDNAARQEAGREDEGSGRLTFRDTSRTLTEEQVKAETARCLGCGASFVDPNKCIGCGVCTTRCEFDAIHLIRDHPENTHMIKAEDKYSEIVPMVGVRFGETVKTTVKKIIGKDKE